MATYFDQLCAAMKLCAADPKAIFMGQGVQYPSTSLSPTFAGIPDTQILEMPVAEELQAGMAIGLALQGFMPVCIFPRWNFMLRAADQLINHLDRLPIYSAEQYRPKIVIRTAIPSTTPFNPQSQHDDDFTDAFKAMFRTVRIVTLPTAESIIPAYRDALESRTSTILVEMTEHYKAQRGA